MNTCTKMIILVDDENAITNSLEPFLFQAGYEIKTVRDGEASLRAVIICVHNWVVLDVLVPQVKGREALSQIRINEDWTPIIMLTQVGESVEHAMALTERADDYINKTFDHYELTARIQPVLRGANPGRPP